MKIADLFEHSSANPFVGLVSSIDLRIKEVEQATHATSNSTVFTSSLKSQLNDLLKFVESASKWNIPEPKLRADFHGALPFVKKHISAAINSVSTPSAAVAHLFSARNVAIKRSHLKFGDIE